MTQTLKQWRKDNRYSQKTFADMLKKKASISVTPQAINAWENGYALPPLDKALAVQTVTGGKVKPESFVRKAEAKSAGASLPHD